MSQVQEIIVYRSPAEKAIWDAVSTNDYMFPIVCAVVVFILAFVAFHWLCERVNRLSSSQYIKHNWLRRYATQVALILAVVCSIIVFNKMII